MTKLHWLDWLKRHRTVTFLTTLFYAGLAQNPTLLAQTIENALPTKPGMQLIPGGSAFGPGGISSTVPHDFDQDFTPSSRYGIALAPTPSDPENTSQYWLEFGGVPRTDRGMNAQIGLGYSPSPDLGFTVGPFLDLDAATPGNIGIYQTDRLGAQRRIRSGFSGSGTGDAHDAGLAGSLSYMPLEDIWIGLHGSVSRDLTPRNSEDGLLDGIDAMLGLTARYRIEF